MPEPAWSADVPSHIGQVTDMCGSTPRRVRGISKIGRLTDVRLASRGHHPVVTITIHLDAIDPPAGRVSVLGGPEVPFEGWLGLLRVLSEVLSSSDR